MKPVGSNYGSLRLESMNKQSSRLIHTYSGQHWYWPSLHGDS